MTKGTPSRGKHQKIQVVMCRRCGRRAYNLSKRRCSACGFGESSRLRNYTWQTKPLSRNIRLR
ncbi:MAG: 50S ribosomal protein L37e [Candidatus Bathyarchaeota archaeon]|nr:MAG: 50S ribosomal protein L37e [Candidatus Bathyarchaeota archaeon]